MNELDPQQHMFIGGNHDNYDIIDKSPHYLGDYGEIDLESDNTTASFWFVRGGMSIDMTARKKHFATTGIKSWWNQEELSQKQGLNCLDEYEAWKPNVVITHDCPADISSKIGNPRVLQAFGWPTDYVARTQHLLQQMWKIHQPKLWIFGHMHKKWNQVINGTHFYCLDELQYLDFDMEWNIIK